MATKTFLSTVLLIFSAASAWQKSPQTATSKVSDHSRRSLLLNTPILAITSFSTISNAATDTSNLQFTTTGSGLQYADVKLGSSSTPSPQNGQTVSIDYVMSTTGARYGSKIYSTVDTGAPYRWKLGDGSTIPGVEEAVRGMNPGGIRRVIIPSKLAYQSTSASAREECEDGKGLGPKPPASEAIGEFQRFKNIYCNVDRVYQPDLVMDIKLYGKRN
jgi:FKBP-type peptidyl-prolyl cis-trans isomerase